MISSEENNKKYSTPIGLIIIVIWGLVVVFMMLNKIKEYTNQYTDNNCSSNSSMCYK